MSEHSAISWTDATWNCLVGCTRVSEGCDLCYAARSAATRLKNTSTYKGLAVITPSGRPAFNGTVRYLPHKLAEPLRWQAGRKIFVNSMSDLFHDAVPEVVIDRVFAVMALAQRHTFQLLTKRPERMRAYCDGLTRQRIVDCCSQDAEGRPSLTGGGHSLEHIDRLFRRVRIAAGEKDSLTIPKLPLPNVWLGVSVENQITAERIAYLLLTRAAVRWISAEPLLGPLDLDGYLGYDLTLGEDDRGMYAYGRGLDWVVIGGESGPGHRAMDPAWAEALSAQCAEERVPVWMKQDSGPKPGCQGRLSDDLWHRKELPTDAVPA